jgi:hypothetical protein
VSIKDIFIPGGGREKSEGKSLLNNIPFARLCSTQRQPLSGFPKIWASFPDERIKFIRNVVEFNHELKMYFLNLLSAKPNCTRLLCPHCHLSKNAGNSLNLSVDVNVHF